MLGLTKVQSLKLAVENAGISLVLLGCAFRFQLRSKTYSGRCRIRVCWFSVASNTCC